MVEDVLSSADHDDSSSQRQCHSQLHVTTAIATFTSCLAEAHEGVGREDVILVEQSQVSPILVAVHRALARFGCESARRDFDAKGFELSAIALEFFST